MRSRRYGQDRRPLSSPQREGNQWEEQDREDSGADQGCGILRKHAAGRLAELGITTTSGSVVAKNSAKMCSSRVGRSRR